MRLQLFGLLLVSVLTLAATAASAESCNPNCNTPTVSKTTMPVWRVVNCVIGPAEGPYEVINCRDSNAVHDSPLGKQSLCFIGSDNKIHWDYPSEVVKGRRFINRRLSGGRWVVDWQDPQPKIK